MYIPHIFHFILKTKRLKLIYFQSTKERYFIVPINKYKL